MKILSTFSLQMVSTAATIKVTPVATPHFTGIGQKEVDTWVIGHPGTAAALTKMVNASPWEPGADLTRREEDGYAPFSSLNYRQPQKRTGYQFVSVPVKRDRVTLQQGDCVYVAQPIGERLAPGQEVAEPVLSWFLVEVLQPALPPEPPAQHSTFWHLASACDQLRLEVPEDASSDAEACRRMASSIAARLGE